MASKFKDEAVLLIGLGRFGSALGEKLERMGTQVMAVDGSADLVQEWSGRLTHVVQADATNVEAMRQIGCHEFKIAVVAIGTGVEASVLSTSVLQELGVPEIWAKAISGPHGRILERIGAAHVVYPERDAGTRVAHLLTGSLIDFTEIDDGYAMAKVRAPKRLQNKTVAETELRSREGITIVAIRTGASFATVNDETVINPGDVLVLAGPTKQIEEYAGK